MDYEEARDILWDRTWTDWHASVSHTLTEPVCPFISLEPDDERFPKLNGFIGKSGDLNQSVADAVEYHLKNLDKFFQDNPTIKNEVDEVRAKYGTEK